MHTDHVIPEYFELDREQKEFMQRFLFLDYAEEWNVLRFRKDDTATTLEIKLETDMYLHKADENYETVQLYLDVIERYKNEFHQFE